MATVWKCTRTSRARVVDGRRQATGQPQKAAQNTRRDPLEFPIPCCDFRAASKTPAGIREMRRQSRWSQPHLPSPLVPWCLVLGPWSFTRRLSFGFDMLAPASSTRWCFPSSNPRSKLKECCQVALRCRQCDHVCAIIKFLLKYTIKASYLFL